MTVMSHRARAALAAGRSGRVSTLRLWLAVAAACAAVYAVTASWSLQGDDANAAAWPAWSVAHRGTLDLSHIAQLPGSAWFIHVHGHLLSNRMIGVIAAGVPVNALLGWTGIGATPASALTAVLLTSAAVASLTVALRTLVGIRAALAAAAVTAFGTALWTVSSEELWTHTADAFWLSLALLALSRRQNLLAGLAMAPSVLTRPHLALAGVVIALVLGAYARSWRTLAAVGLPPALAVGVLAALNHLIYGPWSITGGYGAVGYSVQAAGSLQGPGANAVQVVLTNVAGALVSPACGVLLYTPVVLLALLVVPAHWRTAPAWTKAAAAGAVAYELAQCRINSFTGAGGFYSNRLVIESLVLMTPLLTHCLCGWMGDVAWRRGLTAAAGAASIGIHAIGAFVNPLPTPGVDPWTSWYLLEVVRSTGAQGPVLAFVAAGLVIVATRSAAGRVSSAGRRDAFLRPAGSAVALARPDGRRFPPPFAADR